MYVLDLASLDLQAISQEFHLVRSDADRLSQLQDVLINMFSKEIRQFGTEPDSESELTVRYVTVSCVVLIQGVQITRDRLCEHEAASRGRHTHAYRGQILHGTVSGYSRVS